MAFDLKGEVEKYRQQQMMMGRAPIAEFGGGDPTEFLTNLYFNDAKLADQWAQQAGLNREDFLANVSRVNQSAQDRRGSNVFSTIGNLTRIGRGEATGFDDFFRDAAALAAVGYGTSFLPGGAGGSAAGSTAEGLAPITLSPSVAPISSPVGAAWAAPNATAAGSPAASAFGPASSGSGGFFSRLGDLLRGNSYRAPNLGSGSNYQPQPVVPMRTQMARGLLSTGNPSPSPARSLMAQQLLAQALRGPNQSGSLVESAAIAAPHILSALLMKQEQKAQAQAQQQRAAQQQALAGALSRSTQSDPYKSEAARRAAMIISGSMPDDPLAQMLLTGQAERAFAQPKIDIREVGDQLIDVTDRNAPRTIFSAPQSPDIERVGQRIVLGGQEAEVFRDKTTNQLFVQDAMGSRRYLGSSDVTTPPERVEQGGPGSFDPRTRSQQGADVQKFQDSAIGFTGAVQTATDLMAIAESSPESLGAPGTILRVGNEFARTAISLGGMLGVDIGADRDLDSFDYSKFRGAAIENQAFRAGIYNIALATAVADQGARPSDRDVQLIIDQLAGSTADPKAFARTMGGFVERLDRRIRTTARVKRIPQEIQDAAFSEFDSALQQFRSALPSTQRAEDLPGFNDLTPGEQEELRRRLSVR